MGNWIKLCDQKPANGQGIMIITAWPNMPMNRRLAEYWEGEFWVGEQLYPEPTHWMPLPDPPEAP